MTTVAETDDGWSVEENGDGSYTVGMPNWAFERFAALAATDGVPVDEYVRQLIIDELQLLTGGDESVAG